MMRTCVRLGNVFIWNNMMKIITREKNYNGMKYTATLSGYTNKRYANYHIAITWWWNTKEDAKQLLIQKAKEMIEEINQVIYK